MNLCLVPGGRFGKSPDQEKSYLIQNPLFLLKKKKKKYFSDTFLQVFFYTKERFLKTRETVYRFFPSFLSFFPREHHFQVTPSKEHA